MSAASPRVGPDLPSEAQLAHLQRLCAAAGQRYTAPRDRRQARARIRDLEVAVAEHRARPSEHQRTRDNSVPLAPLLHKLERAHYNDAPQRVIRKLQDQIEAILEAARLT